LFIADVENTDTSNSFIDVSSSIFFNTSESGTIRVIHQHSEYSNSSLSKLNQPAARFSNGVNPSMWMDLTSL